jgi:NADPH2 dehydrogenase
MTRFPHLAMPFSIGSRTVPNRIVMPPLVVFTATEDGILTEQGLEHYRSSSGPGLIVVEASVVSPEGRLARQQIGIFDDTCREGLTRLARVIHDNGAVASIQIHHAGAATNLKNTFGMPIVAPSALPNAKGEMPLELTESGIQRIIDCFVAASRRAREAGFDAVEVHGAHGYLASQFLSPLANRRGDQWGGSLENRARFLREILRRIRSEHGDKLLAYCRLGVADGTPGGLTLDEGLRVAGWLVEDGAPLLSISHGIGGAPKGIGGTGPLSDLMTLAAVVKKGVSATVVGVGGIAHPERAEALIADGVVDLVAVGRGMLADPQWAAKTLRGEPESIVACRQCKICQHFGHAERCPARNSI